MKQLPYLLTLLLFLAQVDDTWAITPVLPSAPLAQVDDDDEYIPSERRTEGEEPSARQTPSLQGLKTQSVKFSIGRTGVARAWDLATLRARPSLYIFMSLQI
jgi:hypothetical protein